MSRPGHEEAWSILREVSEELRKEEDSKGDLKNDGEARALNRMRKSLQGEISKDATLFLKQNGFDGGGQRRKRR